MSVFNDLIDLETLVKLRKAAPKVAQMPLEVAKDAVIALVEFSKNPAHEDLAGNSYWEASLKELLELSTLGGEGAIPAALGKTYRLMGLLAWRKSDGYHVAWSDAQLRILVEYLNL